MRAAGINTIRRAFPRAPVQKQYPVHSFDLTKIYIAAFPSTLDPTFVARRLGRLPGVEYAEPKYYQHTLDTPNDPLLVYQAAAFTRLNAFNGWSLGKGSHSVPIAAVDGGTYWKHEDLKPNLWINSAEDINHDGIFEQGPPPQGDEDGIDQDGNGFVDDVIGWNFALGTNDPSGLPSQPGNSSHGTAVSSHFGAVTNNDTGMAGTSWNCSLMPICAASNVTDNFIEFGYEGIEYAARMGARVINCSWGRAGGASKFEEEVIDAASAGGALIVAAAGNEADNNDYLPHYPSSYRNVLGVGATNSSDDVLASFSNYGITVPVYAPGVSIFSALTNGGYGSGGSGTSFSSPLVAGLAGILFASHPSWTPQQVAAQIRITADAIDALPGNSAEAGMLGRGRVNFARALSETHPMLEVSSVTMLTPEGKDIFIRGDSVLVHVRVQNVLFTQANGVSFTLSSQNPELQILSGTAVVGSIAPGQIVEIPAFVSQVSSTAEARTVVLKLAWVSNGSETDATAFRAFVYPSEPTWLPQVAPTALSLFSVRAVDRNVAWVCGGSGTGSDAVVLRTSDGGTVWTDATSNLPHSDLFCIEAVDRERAWVGTGGGQIYATTDGGQTWVAQHYGGAQSPFIDGVWFFDAASGYVLGDPPAGSTQFVLLRTTNGGSTWDHLAGEPVGGSGEAGWNNSFWWSDPRHGWFGTNASHIWRTADGGATWQSAPSGGASSFALTFPDSLTGVAGHGDGAVGRSTDGGLTWSQVAFPSTDAVTSLASVPGQPLIWASTAPSAFRSSDAGAHWAPQLVAPFTGGLNHLSFADTSRGWAVTGNGEILRYSPVDTGAGGRETPLPSAYLLAQNYPNPFNTSTVIEYAIPPAAPGEDQVPAVRLAVYDILGREVAALVQARIVPGSYDVRFYAGGLASGVYLYRLTARKYAETRKMILLK